MLKLAEKYAPRNDAIKEENAWRVSFSSLMMILTIIVFVSAIAFNTYTQMSASSTSDEDKSRVCLA